MSWFERWTSNSADKKQKKAADDLKSAKEALSSISPHNAQNAWKNRDKMLALQIEVQKKTEKTIHETTIRKALESIFGEDILNS